MVNIEELKKLIQQAENNKIPWDTEITLSSWLKVKKKNLQNVLPENWNKIEHTRPSWSDLSSQIEKSNKLLKKDQNSDWKFASKEILEGYKKYANSEEKLNIKYKLGIPKSKKIRDINENDTIESRWSTISDRLKDGQKIFGRDNNSSTYQSEDAFRFLQSIVNNHLDHTIRYQPNQTFKLEEWKHDNRNNFTWDKRDAKKVAEELGETVQKDIEQKSIVEVGKKWVEEVKEFTKEQLKEKIVNDGYQKKLEREGSKEKNIELKYRLNAVQNKPEAYLWLAHLLSPLYGKRTHIEIKASVEVEKLNNEQYKKIIQELEKGKDKEKAGKTTKEVEGLDEKDSKKRKIESISLIEEDKLFIEYNDAKQLIIDSIPFFKLQNNQKNYLESVKKDKKVLSGITVDKESKEKRFFRLEEKYDNEERLHRDASWIIRKIILKRELDSKWVLDHELKRIFSDQVASGIFWIPSIDSEKAKKVADGFTELAHKVSTPQLWVFTNGRNLLWHAFSHWDSLFLGDIDTAWPANNIRTGFKILSYEPNIKEAWRKELKNSLKKLKAESAELSISEEFIDEKFKQDEKDEKGKKVKYFKNIKYYGGDSSEFYMLYTRVLDDKLPNYIKKVKEEMGTRFIKFNQTFEKEKKKSFGDFVIEKLTEEIGSVDDPNVKSSRFYFQPDQVWKEIDDAKEEIQRKTLDIAPTAPLGLQRDDNTLLASFLKNLGEKCRDYLKNGNDKKEVEETVEKIKDFKSHHKYEIEESVEDIIDSLWYDSKKDDGSKKKIYKSLIKTLRNELSDGIKSEIKIPEYKEVICKNKDFSPKNKVWTEAKELPIKLFDVKKFLEENKQVKFTEENVEKKLINEYVKEREKGELEGVKKYATLSYVCSDLPFEEQKKMSTKAKKSLARVIGACEHLGIDHLWVDKLCVNQEDDTEKAQEIRKFFQYYNNSAVTLVSLGGKLREENGSLPSFPEILRKIVNSRWFKRSWTYQEGWLSKQTIFVFDDALIDGQAIAQTWVLNQPVYTKYAKYNSLDEEAKSLKKIATPLGWVRYKDGYDPEDRLTLSLGQALKEVKYRERISPIDGIYTLLGLLPYGRDVPVSYSDNTPKKALKEIMKTAMEKGYYGEFFGWHGSGEGGFPKIVGEKGSTSSQGGLTVLCRCKRDLSEHNCKYASLDDKGIKIKGSWYSVTKINKERPIGIEDSKGFIIEGGLHKRNVLIESISEELILTGASETLDDIEEGDSLIVLEENEWESESPFAILVSEKGKTNVYHRKGLVGFYGKSEVEKLKEIKKDSKELIISINQELEIQARQEVPPKGNN